MISLQEATQQVNRLNGLREFPKLKEGLSELIVSLREASRDLKHAASIVTRWLEVNEFAPTPSRIYETASLLAAEALREAPILNPKVIDFASFHAFWTDRDVAIHEALAAEGKTKWARKYGTQMLEGWNAYCASKGDSWEVPRFEPRRHPRPYAESGQRYPCMACFATGWEYLGPFSVRRCDCRGVRLLTTPAQQLVTA